MVKKPTFILTSLMLALACSLSPLAFAQDEAAPKISISFADDEEKPAETAPATQPATQPAAATDPAQPAATGAAQYSEEEILFAIYGWFLVHRNQVDMIDVSKEERLAFLSGVNTALAQKEIPGWQEHMPSVTALMDQRWAPVYERLQRERKAQTVELFAGLAKQENVKKSATGLFYEIVSEGTGKFPSEDSAVSVEFEAKLVDGSVFETTEGRGGPIPIVLANMVPGVREGLQNVREGGIIKLWVPASLGFGSEEKPGIPADSALLFEFTLHEIGEAEPVEAP
ncbi:FKBP-type peptidyl-prolyl cis-trans isomerase [Opitutia bacterium ISCC 51]|nr:FKBP-type peptidyl-prolyl cis-trans isomerase [Opitutae bacterium ISCC 51]QXD28050.1 FKBP-type peptidyl-prolyl cis-trans isomerase [Opitutae bacterium ISCC 52]